MTKKRKAALGALLLVVLLLAGLAVYFCAFTPTGYRMTVPLHGFAKVGERVYVDRGWAGDARQLLSLVEEARGRVETFFGEVRSAPVLIVSDDAGKIERLGGDHDTMTVVLGGARSYTAVSSEFLNVDVLAHEMTHAETHRRIYADGRSASGRIPIWFDEGLAVQNDYREPYTEEAWLALTDGGRDVPQLSEYGDAETFFSGTTADRRARYCLAGHEVSAWIEHHGREALLSLLDSLAAGQDFQSLYFGT